MAKNANPLDCILSELEKRVADGGAWQMSFEEVCSLHGISLEDGYRRLYREKQLISGYIPGVFEFDNVIDMVSLLAGFLSADVEQAFSEAGAYLDYEDVGELAALYYDEAVKSIDAHRDDTDTFAQMLTRFKSKSRAFSIYRDYFFEPGMFEESAIARFVAAKKYRYPQLGEYTTRCSLRRLFERHILSEDALFEPLLSRLAGTPDSRTDSPAYDRSMILALDALGLSRLPGSISELRSHYKSLMKTYHPDVNPSGLEKSKKINAAYAEIMARAV